jgi:hypothetical protein
MIETNLLKYNLRLFRQSMYQTCHNKVKNIDCVYLTNLQNLEAPFNLLSIKKSSFTVLSKL